VLLGIPVYYAWNLRQKAPATAQPIP